MAREHLSPTGITEFANEALVLRPRTDRVTAVRVSVVEPDRVGENPRMHRK